MPRLTTVSLAIQPVPYISSLNVIVAGSSVPVYTRMDFLPKITAFPSIAATCTTSSIPCFQTCFRSIEALAPPLNLEGIRMSDISTTVLSQLDVTHACPFITVQTFPFGNFLVVHTTVLSAVVLPTTVSHEGSLPSDVPDVVQ